jgi:hypothetical protein
VDEKAAAEFSEFAHSRWSRLARLAYAAVTQVSAYSSHGELGYAVPFTSLGSVLTERWLRPGQKARPGPATYTIGSGTVHGVAWTERLYVGPWGSCLGGTSDGSECWTDASQPARQHGAGQVGVLFLHDGTSLAVFDAAPSVSYLLVRRADGSTSRENLVRAGRSRFCVIVSAKGRKATRWAAYSANGTRLASGSFTGS